MKASEFFKCTKSSAFTNLVDEGKRYLILSDIARKMIAEKVAGKNNEDIFDAIHNEMLERYREDNTILNSVMNVKNIVEADMKALKRLVAYYENNGYKFIEEGFKTEYRASEPLRDGSNNIVAKVDAILEKDGVRKALIIRYGKCNESPKGRGASTSTQFDLRSLLAEGTFRKNKMTIDEIDSFFLFLDEEKDGIIGEEVVETNTKNTNVFHLNLSNLKTDEIISRIKSNIKEDNSFQVTNSRCKSCSYFDICSIIPMRFERKELSETRAYELPAFTEEQLQIVNFKEGKARVCACAGSGKTSALVGRVKWLGEQGVMLPNIAMFAFTNKAADEIADRVSSFTDEGNSPLVSTINGFCYDVLQHSEKYIGKVELLTEGQNHKMLEYLLNEYLPIKGLSYNKGRGMNGLISRVMSIINNYHSTDERAKARYDALKIDKSRFEKMIAEYDNLIQKGGYITYDEQISMCIQLFKEHPDVLEVYQNIYKYIMVDEYQDINPEQEELITLLSAKYGNLVVVGDDDQSIYGFRGADPKFFIDFAKRHENVKEVFFSENFRSSSAIVESAETAATKATDRVKKSLKAAQGGGVSPILCKENDCNGILRCINDAIAEGYSYEDIKVLARTNGTLEKLYEELKKDVPVYLSKATLINDRFFQFVRTLLHLTGEEISDDWIFRLVKFCGEDIETIDRIYPQLAESNADILKGEKPEKEKPYFRTLTVLNVMRNLYAKSEKAEDFIRGVYGYTGYDRSDAPSILLNLVADNQIDLEHLISYIDEIYEIEDDTKVETIPEGKIGLMTYHESKGREFPVVVMYNDNKADDVSDQFYHLMYVACTRAKSRVFLLEDFETQVLLSNVFDKYIPIEEYEEKYVTETA